MRLEDGSATLRNAIPAEYGEFVAVVTELGGTTVLTLLLAVLFWCSDRRRSALVISYAVAGLGLLLSIKTLMALPRPPEDAMLVALEGERDGYGFPSGHAFAATVVYGGLVAAYDRLGDWRAVAGASTLVAAVSLSRVVLGVHYLGDVIVGVALGIAFVIAMNRLTGGDPTNGFTIAVCLSIPAVFIVGGTEDALLGLGGSVGGLVASRRLAALPELRSRLEGGVLVGVGGSFVAVVRELESVVAPVDPLLVVL
ncbi:phosphatase PAP2 family protein [Natrinema caseinilyticum]|uniref:phosphatase PAP2 family protein n=1 Tax=Natrinema caseinilyticum TaxID=2961570 RepID=UPI0020C3D000|nr:phosphatase PAP2 family protein [Natrinema caseinilyticum]